MSENLSAHARTQPGSLHSRSRTSAVSSLRSARGSASGLAASLAATVLVCALGLAGCAEVGPDYRQPASTMPAAFHNGAALAAHDALAPAPAPALDTWWNGFNDP